VVFVSLGGEAVGDALWTRLREAPGLGAYNLYGPTEYTINALGADLADSPQPTVGRPIANTQAYILGPGLLPSPVGVTGELYLGGVGLARGYIGRAAATAERFIANPFAADGARLYRTGDLARWRSDGSIDYLGRSDNQLKIRGYRIEPAEVENALVANLGVKRAAVLGRPSQDGSLRLVAYVVCDSDAAGPDALRESLRACLPPYMVPAAITVVDDLPRTINGKLDTAALPAPAAEERVTAPPRTATEQAICDAFANVLDHHPVGRFDDFFDLGGHSLLTVRLVGLLREALECSISVRQIYDHPSPAALAASLDAAAGGSQQGVGVVAEDDPDQAQMIADAVLPPDLSLPGTVFEPPRPVLANLGAVLLTGAAGFLGSYLLAELLHETKADLYCMVRAVDGPSAVARVRKALSAYGLWKDGFEQRLIGVPGDLMRPRFGLSDSDFHALAERVEVIVHNGGSTNEFDPYVRSAATNVAGAKEILRLATYGRRVRPIHFVSTASVVARRGDNPPVIGEDTRLSVEQVERTGYVQSKWVAEELMHKAAEQGLPVTIHRPGRVSGHSLSGACSTGVGFWHFIQAMLLLGAVPKLRSDRLTLAPVDYVARALVALIERGDPGATYHLSNRMQTSITAIAQAARKVGYDLEEMPFADWRHKLRQTAEARAQQGDDALTPVLLLADHIDKYDGAEGESALGQDAVIAALTGSGITPPSVTEAVLSRYIDYFINVGFFPPLPGGAAAGDRL
jgi:thioester reductase-like protein